MKLLSFFLFFWLFFTKAFGESSFDQEDQNLFPHIHYSKDKVNIVGRIYIGGHDKSISEGTFIYVKKALEYFRSIHPIFIILELDTPGGEVFAAQKISDLLKETDTQYGIPVIAFINNWAISAGAMLAYSCRYISVVKDGSMGAAEPVSQAGEKTSEKINSAIRADFANRADFFERNSFIAEAMVDPDITLVSREGKLLKLDNVDQIKESDLVVTTKGKLLTLNSKELLEYKVADIRLFPEKCVPVTAEERKTGEWSAAKELLFTYPFFREIQADILTYKMDWKTHFFSFLASSAVTSLLFLGLIVSFYLEFSTPGFGAFGIVGLLCLFLLILSSSLVQMSSYLEFILLGVGILFILIEVFFLPGTWIAGVIGGILAFAGLMALILPGIEKVHYDFDTHTLNAAGQYVFQRIVWLSGATTLGVSIIAILAKFLAPTLRKYSPFVLRGEQEDFRAGMSKEELPELGSWGRVVSPLRTAGKVEIDKKIYDAVSSGSFVDKDESIKLIRIEGSKLVVEQVKRGSEI